MSKILKDKLQKAKKDHVCDWCERTIRKGTKYRYLAAITDDGFNQLKLHEECDSRYQGVISEYSISDGDFADISDLKRDLTEDENNIR